MSRLILTAVLTMTALLLAAYFGQPAQAPPQPVVSTPLIAPPEMPAADEQSVAELPAEVASILEIRRQLGSVVDGTSLDQQDDGRDFAESLERLLKR